LSEEIPIPVAVVPALNTNPVLGSVTTIPPSQTSPNVDQPYCDDLFQSVLNECPNNGMNSSEFMDFMKNLSYSSKELFIIFTAVF
jgi:hypothetical protein